VTSISDMDTLLDEPIENAAARAASEFDRIVSRVNGRFVLFGAGLLGTKTLQALRDLNVEPIAFSDNDSRKWNQSLDGVEVLPPSEAAERFGRSAAFVVTIFSPGHSYSRTEGQLTALGCKIIVPWALLAWKYPEGMLPHYFFGLPQEFLKERDEALGAFHLMADEESRRVFRANLLLRLRGCFQDIQCTCPGEQYFPDTIVNLTEQEVFIDGGAYNGDTIEVFLKQCASRFSKIVAFEPDPATYHKLQDYVSRLETKIRQKVFCRNAALGSQNGKISFDAEGTLGSCANASGSTEVDCVALDEDQASSPPTFIKLDVEGSELDALAGAKKIIGTNGPLLAVCVYHRPFDLWRVPLYLASVNPGYRFFLRQHEDDGHESVVYAVPSNRKARE
jgi:FkbM family methyltransferase